MSKNCLQRGLSSAGPTAAAVGTLEEKLAALEKSRDYNTGLNNLQTDNVAIPPRAIGYVNHINFTRFQGTFIDENIFRFCNSDPNLNSSCNM